MAHGENVRATAKYSVLDPPRIGKDGLFHSYSSITSKTEQTITWRESLDRLMEWRSSGSWTGVKLVKTKRYSILQVLWDDSGMNAFDSSPKAGYSTAPDVKEAKSDSRLRGNALADTLPNLQHTGSEPVQGDGPVVATADIQPSNGAPWPVRIVCLKLSVQYFDDRKDAIESEQDDDFKEEQLGLLRAYAETDPLSKVRADIYRQVEADHIPIKFHFLRPHDPNTDSSLFWVESIPWHKESNVPLSACLTADKTSLMISSPISIVRNDKLKDKTVEEIRALWDRERRGLLMEIHQLEAQLAESRRDQEFSPNSSLLKRTLIQLKQEGFVEKDVDILEQDYLKVYSQHDADSVFNSNATNPFRFAIRRMAEDPVKMRAYLESLQSILVRYRIRKNRLTSKYWARVLRDMRFVNDPGLFKTWADSRPWTADEAERSAYLGSYVLSDTMSLDEFQILLDPVPSIDTFEQQKVSKTTSAAEDPYSKSFHQDSHRTIAEAAAKFHLKAMERHLQSATAPLASVEDEKKAEETPVSPVLHRKVPLDHACDSFQVDMLAAQFGICVCGYPRWDHEKTRHRLSQQINDGHAKQPRYSMDSVKTTEPCDSYQVDLSATRYGVCVCGFDQKDHRQEKTKTDDQKSHMLRPTASQSKLDATTCQRFTPAEERPFFCSLCGRDKSKHEEQSDAAARPTSVVRAREHTAKACDAYHVDVEASRYGVCMCGHDKSEHRTTGRYSFEEPSPAHDWNSERHHDADDRYISSKTRAQYAFRWVEGEISRLISRIEAIAERDEHGNYHTTFGELFARYQNISDTLVGILVRAKRRKILEYDGGFGDLLLQGKHDDVVITLLQDQVERWRREREPQASSDTATSNGTSLH